MWWSIWTTVLKTCSKFRQSCNNIDVIILCGGWNDISCEKGSCEYWIHKSNDFCQTEYDVNYCPSCFIILKFLSNDDNTIPENNVILRTASSNDDVITEFNSGGSEYASMTQTFISESCKSVYSKLKQINLSIDSCCNNNGSPPISPGSPPIIISILESAPIKTPEEKVSSPTTSTDVYENDLTLGNETNINNNVLDFFYSKFFFIKIYVSRCYWIWKCHEIIGNQKYLFIQVRWY